jgi:hypothetical protein
MKNSLKLKLNKLVYLYRLFIYLCLMLFITSLSACTTSFTGILPTVPSWVSVGPTAWRNKDITWVFASGIAFNIPKIMERRSIAEGKATQNLKQKLSQKIQRMMKKKIINNRTLNPQDVQDVQDVLDHLPWAQMCSIEARFFEANKNIQHALVGLSWKRFEEAVSQDSTNETTKSLVKNLGKSLFIK